MYRFLLTALTCSILSYFAYLQLQEPIQDNRPLLAFQLIICTYIGIASIVIFFLSHFIKKHIRIKESIKNQQGGTQQLMP